MATSQNALDRECNVFCRAIAGIPAPPAVSADYIRAHQVGPLQGEGAPFDRTLVGIAGAAPALVRAADSYAVLFARDSLLRRKLVLLLAILESHAQTSRIVDTPRSRSLGKFALMLPFRLIVFAIQMILAFVVLAPMHVLLGNMGRR